MSYRLVLPNTSGRSDRIFLLRLGLGVLACILSAWADAQEIQIQEAGVLRQASIGIGSSAEYFDAPIADSTTTTVAGGVAYNGWALSAWMGHSRGRMVVGEHLLSYSHKLPLVDVHLGLAGCHVDGLRSECVSGPRLTLSTNTSSSSVLDATVGYAPNGDRKIYSVSAVKELGGIARFRFAVRGSASRWSTPSMRTTGASLRMIATYPIRPTLRLDAVAAYVHTRDDAGSRPLYAVNLVWMER